MAKYSIKKGDYVQIISGVDSGKTGVITGLDTKTGRVLLEGDKLTPIKRHVKARKASDKGGIIERPGTVDVSNVMPICAACNKPTRVKHGDVDGKAVRICVACGAVLETKKPAKVKAAVKKATVRKKANAEDQASEAAPEVATEQVIETAATEVETENKEA